MVQKNSLNKILIICGPTASGKTDLSIECAKLLDTEIISADSMNIYKNLNIGTAKPSLEERKTVIHNLIDVIEPSESFTVSDYKGLAKPCINKILSNSKIPVICGGTGFYINSIIYNLSYGNGEGNLEIRNYYKNLAIEKGNEYVYNILLQKDYESAQKIHFNDQKRVIRALEILENGCKKSQIKDDLTPNYDYSAYAFDYEREVLHSRINNRVDLMIKNGLIDEVNQLIKSGITINNQCMQGIGYKEIYSYLIGETDLPSAIELIKLNTRHYAKRQITFFKKLPNIKWIKPGDNKIIAERIVAEL